MNTYAELIAFIKDEYMISFETKYINVNDIIINIVTLLFHQDNLLSEEKTSNINFMLRNLTRPDEFIEKCVTPYAIHLKLKEICDCVIDLRYLTIAMHHNNVYNNEAIEEFFEIANQRNMLIVDLYKFYRVNEKIFKTNSIGSAMFNNWNASQFDKLESHPLIEAHKIAIPRKDLPNIMIKLLNFNNNIVDIYFMLSFASNKSAALLYKDRMLSRDKERQRQEKDRIINLEKELAELKNSSTIDILKAQVKSNPGAIIEIIKELTEKN